MNRFRLTLLTLAFALTALTASAQIKFGVTGGLNLSKLSLNEMPDISSSNRAGWYIGPKVEINVPVAGLGIEAAIEYSQKDLRQKQDVTDAAKTKHYRSIEIPVNLRYQFGLDALAVYVKTGPQFGFYIGDNTWQFAQREYKMKSANINWNIGAGIKALSHLEIGVGYNFALTKYAKTLGITTGSDKQGDFKANSFQVEVAYLF
ncbi:MAG: outer membrane beta-barrel protein [Prevotellaceae bacterium]|nr:outer membrane beta-barrel protein [Prevotellaceae bacterium]MDY3856189.1 outer membrane beta-barrel protein [Bacteroidaceae bacterium]